MKRPGSDRTRRVARAAEFVGELSDRPLPVYGITTGFGRLANGVGLDAPASAVRALHALRDAGYHTHNLPKASLRKQVICVAS